MKKGNANCKTKKIAARVLALIMLITCIAMPVFGGTTETKTDLIYTGLTGDNQWKC